LTEADWKVYLETIAEAARRRDNETGYSIWEAGTLQHQQVVRAAHGNPLFLFYHRQLLRWMERKLQTINPRFAFFYWDSAREFNLWTQSKIWTRLGTARSNLPMRDGPLHDVYFNFTGDYLMRNWTFPNAQGNPPSVEFYNQLYQDTLRKPNGLEAYTTEVEWAHGTLHNLVGGRNGHMTRMSLSPLDPIFYAHHAHIDYLFHRTQLGWASNKYPRSYSVAAKFSNGTLLTEAHTIPGHSNVTVGELIDLDSLCIRYAPFGEVSTDLTTNSTSTVTGTMTSISASALPSGANSSNSTESTSATATSSSISTPTVSPSPSASPKPYLPPGYNPQANFTLTLPPEWANMSFGDRASGIKDRVTKVANEVNDKLKKGEAIAGPPKAKKTSANDALDSAARVASYDLALVVLVATSSFYAFIF
jgi:hypothetical protein